MFLNLRTVYYYETALKWGDQCKSHSDSNNRTLSWCDVNVEIKNLFGSGQFRAEKTPSMVELGKTKLLFPKD